MAEGGVMRSSGAIRMAAAFALLFMSLSTVVWRQSRALEELRGLDSARSTRAILQAERSELQRDIQRLESRARIVAVASERLGLRVPAATELTILSAPRNSGAVGAVPALARQDLPSLVERHR
jgi:cell division protein FtsL